MSGIGNKPKILDDERANILRGAIWTRATWMALIYEEACKAGWAEQGEQVIRAAIKRYGLDQGKNLKAAFADENGEVDMQKFAQAFGSPTAATAFEAKCQLESDKRMNLEYDFCPLLKAWQDLGYDDATCAKLCDMAMDGDRNTAVGLDMDFYLGDTIANGCPTCQIAFFKK